MGCGPPVVVILMRSFVDSVAYVVGIMEDVPSGLLVALDPNGDVVIGNPATWALFGLSSSRRTANRIPPFRSPIAHAEVRPEALPLQQAMRENRTIVRTDYEIVRADGMRRIVTMGAAPLHGDTGRVEGGIAVLVDVTYMRMLETNACAHQDEIARLAAQEHQLTRSLPGATLPYQLPVVAGFAMSALYQAADVAERLGGDWYDAFPLPDGRIGLSMGDVMGSGFHAAVTMGKLRQAMQSTGLIDADPTRMLEAANLTLALHNAEPFATAIAGILDPVEATLTFASAGHPMPIVRRENGRLAQFAGADPPLGAGPGGAEVHATRLEPGDLAVFYTDGLIESTRDVIAGQRTLRDALRTTHLLHAENSAEFLHRHVLGEVGSPDDVAIMTVSRRLFSALDT
jgi:PAS domain S-box-containing protein